MPVTREKAARYLESRRTGPPGAAELRCLAWLKEWEAGLAQADLLENEEEAEVDFMKLSSPAGKPAPLPPASARAKRRPGWWQDATPAVRRSYEAGKSGR